jgi:hypothetical protein
MSADRAFAHATGFSGWPRTVWPVSPLGEIRLGLRRAGEEDEESYELQRDLIMEPTTLMPIDR